MNFASFIVILAFIVPPILIIWGIVYLLKLDRKIDEASLRAEHDLEEFEDEER